jgi:hypothetical protein
MTFSKSDLRLLRLAHERGSRGLKLAFTWLERFLWIGVPFTAIAVAPRIAAEPTPMNFHFGFSNVFFLVVIGMLIRFQNRAYALIRKLQVPNGSSPMQVVGDPIPNSVRIQE